MGTTLNLLMLHQNLASPHRWGSDRRLCEEFFSVLDKDKSGTLKFSEFADLILARDRFRKKENTQPTVKLASGGIGSHGILGERKDIDAYLDDELLDMVGLGRSPQLSKFKSPVANKETAPTLPAKTENNVASAYTKASASAGKPQKQNQADRSRPRAPKTANKRQTANKIPTTDQTGGTKADAKIKKKNDADHAAFVAKIIANRRKLEKEAHARIVAKRKLKREILEKEKLREQIVEAAIEAAARNARNATKKKKKNLTGEKAKAKPRKSKPVHAKNEITCKPKAENATESKEEESPSKAVATKSKGNTSKSAESDQDDLLLPKQYDDLREQLIADCEDMLGPTIFIVHRKDTGAAHTATCKELQPLCETKSAIRDVCPVTCNRCHSPKTRPRVTTKLDIGDIVRVSKDINAVRNLNADYIPYTRYGGGWVDQMSYYLGVYGVVKSKHRTDAVVVGVSFENKQTLFFHPRALQPIGLRVGEKVRLNHNASLVERSSRNTGGRWDTNIVPYCGEIGEVIGSSKHYGVYIHFRDGQGWGFNPAVLHTRANEESRQS